MTERMSYSFSTSDGHLSPLSTKTVHSSDHPAPQQQRSKIESVAQDYCEFHIECAPVSQSLPSTKNTSSQAGGSASTQTKKRVAARSIQKLKQFLRAGILRKDTKEWKDSDIVHPPSSG